MNEREKALKWWRSLSDKEKWEKYKKYRPEMPFEFVDKSSSIIERIFTEENIIWN